LQGIQGCSRSRLLQALDNAANESLALARLVGSFCPVAARRAKSEAESEAQQVKIIEKLNKKAFGTKCHLKTSTKIINNNLFLIQIKRPLENFHEIFGIEHIYISILVRFITPRLNSLLPR
jgi:hypothetical protein